MVMVMVMMKWNVLYGICTHLPFCVVFNKYVKLKKFCWTCQNFKKNILSSIFFLYLSAVFSYFFFSSRLLLLLCWSQNIEFKRQAKFVFEKAEVNSCSFILYCLRLHIWLKIQESVFYAHMGRVVSVLGPNACRNARANSES